MFIQVMTEEQAADMPYNPFDLTKVWYKKDFPLIEVDILNLTKIQIIILQMLNKLHSILPILYPV